MRQLHYEANRTKLLERQKAYYHATKDSWTPEKRAAVRAYQREYWQTKKPKYERAPREPTLILVPRKQPKPPKEPRERKQWEEICKRPTFVAFPMEPMTLDFGTTV